MPDGTCSSRKEGPADTTMCGSVAHLGNTRLMQTHTPLNQPARTNHFHHIGFEKPEGIVAGSRAEAWRGPQAVSEVREVLPRRVPDGNERWHGVHGAGFPRTGQHNE